MSDLVQARWTCGYSVEVPGQGTIEPGGIASITAGEAATSDHWELVDLADLKLDELTEIAEEVGAEVTGRPTKAKLAKAIDEETT